MARDDPGVAARGERLLGERGPTTRGAGDAGAGAGGRIAERSEIAAAESSPEPAGGGDVHPEKPPGPLRSIIRGMATRSTRAMSMRAVGAGPLES